MKKAITGQDVLELIKRGASKIELPPNTIVTSVAAELLAKYKIKSVYISPQNCSSDENISGNNFTDLKNAVIGSDHTGIYLKNKIKNYLKDKGYKVTDIGTFTDESCDYPDYAFETAKIVKDGKAHFGIMIDATGIPSAITANKLPGIRGAVCYDETSAKSAREHSNANIISFGAETLSEEKVFLILNVWLQSSYLGQRHERRLQKIKNIEKRYFKPDK